MFLCVVQDLPGGQISDNTARRLLDGVGSFAESVKSASARPTQVLGGCIAGMVAPRYWVPNSAILVGLCPSLWFRMTCWN